MTTFFSLLLILYLIYPISSSTLFSIQETLTILCHQFPLVSTVNNSNLQCARLRIDENIPTSEFNLDRPTEIILFIIIHQPLSNLSLVNISIDFNQSPDSPSSINEIRIVLFVPHSNFTINNQNTTEYTPYDIPIFRWQNSTDNTYDLIDLLQINNSEYGTDELFCKWNLNQWNRLFTGNMSTNISYVYFLKTTNPQLTFTLINASNKSSLSLPPSPYLDILYCIPYKLGATEIILIICFGVLFIVIIIIFGILHYFKGGDENRTRHFEPFHHHYHHHHHHRRSAQDKIIRNHSKQVRLRSNASMPYVEQEDQNT